MFAVGGCDSSGTSRRGFRQLCGEKTVPSKILKQHGESPLRRKPKHQPALAWARAEWREESGNDVQRRAVIDDHIAEMIRQEGSDCMLTAGNYTRCDVFSPWMHDKASFLVGCSFCRRVPQRNLCEERLPCRHRHAIHRLRAGIILRQPSRSVQSGLLFGFGP
jgi:hypothetical protein